MIIPNICGANVGIIPKQGKEMPVYHNKKGMGCGNPYPYIIGLYPEIIDSSLSRWPRTYHPC